MEQESSIYRIIFSEEIEKQYNKYINEILLKKCYNLIRNKDDYKQVKEYLNALLVELANPIIQSDKDYEKYNENFMLNCIKDGILSEQDCKSIITDIYKNIPPIKVLIINDEKVDIDLIKELRKGSLRYSDKHFE